MTLRAWLKRERQPHYSGISARETLKRQGQSRSCSAGTFGSAIATRTPDLKRLLFKIARDQRRRGF